MAVLLGAVNNYSERILVDFSRGYTIDKRGNEFIVEDIDGKKRIYHTRESAFKFVKRQKKRK